jgi:hypothetical protein
VCCLSRVSRCLWLTCPTTCFPSYPIPPPQKLYEEGEEHLREVLRKVQASYGGETADSAAAYHTLSLCTFYR